MSALAAGQLILTPAVFRQIVFVPNIADGRGRFPGAGLWAEPNKSLRKKGVVIFFEPVWQRGVLSWVWLL